METIGPSAFIVAILYLLSRWALATVDSAASHPDRGCPAISWKVTWCLAILVSAGSACSAHVWLLTKSQPPWEVFVFNAIVFGAFLIGFVVTGHFDHKVRLGIRSSS